MPADFRYREVFFRGRPRHDRGDEFTLRHPVMDQGKRAKIFSPFDALRGFSEAVAAKDILYEDRPELSEDEQAEISRRLAILRDLTANSRLARANHVRVRVTRFVPCADPDSFSYGVRGRREVVSGLCRGVDAAVSATITVGDTRVRFQDIIAMEADGIFDEDREMDMP